MESENWREQHTYADLTVEEALIELDAVLPAAAYRAIDSDSERIRNLDFTEISPPYMQEHLTKLFGPLGIGWGYREEDFELAGKFAHVKVVNWYKTIEGGRVEWSSRGGSTNAKIEWAIKGALTNAIGAGWSLMGFQRSVYKGERSHNDFKSKDNEVSSANGIPEATQVENPPSYQKKLDVYREIADSLATLGVEDTKGKKALLKKSGIADMFKGMTDEQYSEFSDFLKRQIAESAK